MAIASGASRGLAYGVQSAFGTIASSTKLVNTANAGQALALDMKRLDPSGLREDGQPLRGLGGTRSSTATIPANLSFTDYDDLIAAAIRQAPSAWPAVAPISLGFGTALTYFTLEDRFKDISQYLRYLDMVVNTMEVNATQGDNGAYVTAQFGLIGTSRSVNGTQLATPTAAGTQVPFTTCGGTVSINGASTAKVTSFSFNVDNGLKALFALGNCSASGIVKGPIKVSGSVSAFFEDATQMNLVANQTAIDLSLTLATAAGDTKTFDFPSSVLASDAVSGGTGELTIALPFEASYDSVSGNTIKITNTAHA